VVTFLNKKKIYNNNNNKSEIDEIRALHGNNTNSCCGSQFDPPRDNM